MNQALDSLVSSNPMLWQGPSRFEQRGVCLNSGFEALDAILSGGGWPAHSVVEVMVDHWGIGELQLWLPLMARLSQQDQWLTLIAPPYIPYAPALVNAGVRLDRLFIIDATVSTRDIWWSADKTLRAQLNAMTLVWLPKPDPRGIRRLQLAASAGGSLGVLFHRQPCDGSPAPLRLHLSSDDQGLTVKILKARGGWQQSSVTLDI